MAFYYWLAFFLGCVLLGRVAAKQLDRLLVLNVYKHKRFSTWGFLLYYSIAAIGFFSALYLEFPGWKQPVYVVKNNDTIVLNHYLPACEILNKQTARLVGSTVRTDALDIKQRHDRPRAYISGISITYQVLDKESYARQWLSTNSSAYNSFENLNQEITKIVNAYQTQHFLSKEKILDADITPAFKLLEPPNSKYLDGVKNELTRRFGENLLEFIELENYT